MSQPDVPNPYAPSQVAAQPDTDPQVVAELQLVVGRFQARRIALAAILAALAALVLLGGPLFVLGTLLLLWFAVGYLRAWHTVMRASLVVAAIISFASIGIFVLGLFFADEQAPIPVFLIPALPAVPIYFYAWRTLRLAHRIRRAGYPLTVTSLEIIHARATEGGDKSG